MVDLSPWHLLGKELVLAQQKAHNLGCSLAGRASYQQVQAKAAQKELAAAQQAAKHARDKAGALDSKLQRSQEKNAAQHEQLVQLQAEVASLQQQVQPNQVVMMLIACTMQVYGQASAGYSVYVQHCHLLSSTGHGV